MPKDTPDYDHPQKVIHNDDNVLSSIDSSIKSSAEAASSRPVSRTCIALAIYWAPLRGTYWNTAGGAHWGFKKDDRAQFSTRFSLGRTGGSPWNPFR